MDEFYEYWELIPEFEKYEEVGKEIVKYKRNLQDPDISARDLPPSVIEFFQTHLVIQPYPTWEILYHIIDIRDQKKNRLLEEIVLNALTTLLDQICEKMPGKCQKLYNLLSNLYVSEWCMSKINEIIVPRLFDIKENKELLDNVLYLALLSRSTLSLLTQYMNYERQHIMGKCRTKSLFLRTCYEKVHWIETLLEPENDVAIQAFNPKVYHNLRLIRLMLRMKHETYENTEWWAEFEGIDASYLETNSAFHVCYLELLRQLRISKHLSPVHPLNDQILVKNHIMNQFLNLQVDFSLKSFEALRELFVQNHQLNQQQLMMFGATKPSLRTEVDLFNEYIIVKLYLNIIQASEPSQDFLDLHLLQIRSLLKVINDRTIIFQLMMNVFTLLFLRFEHIRKTKRKRKKSEGSLSNQNNSHTTDVSDAAIDTLQNGFVCLKTSLKAVLNSMRLFLMDLEIYEACDNELKDKFALLLKNVDNALWRLRIVDNESENKKKSHGSVKEWLKLHEDKTEAAVDQATSDDEKKSPEKKVNRKKLKKRPKVALKRDDNDEASDDPIEFQLVTETENSEYQSQSRSSDPQRRVRSVMTKMLMSPESLVSMCMLKGDKENVQKIIQEYNLSSSETAHEVTFINNFKDTKAQLSEIIEKFNKTFSNLKPKSTEINEIKSIAESGFEKAKFLNVLENFTVNNKLKARESDLKLLEKAVTQFPNLRMYQGNFLNVLPLIDLMISLPCPYEFNHIIFKYILQNWDFSEVKDGSFGYRKFLKNIMDVLTVYKNHNEDKTIEEVMNDEIFTLEPVQLKKELENRQTVLDLKKMNLEQLNDEPELLKVIQKFGDFEADVNFFARIIGYVKNVRQLLKFQTNQSFGVDEVIRMNVDEIIGRTIFELQHSPEQVENFAFNSKINLPHSMAIAAVGEFLGPAISEEEDILPLFLISEIDNELELKVKHVINNMDILYYIKREGSFMVAFLVKEIQNVDYKTLKYDEPNFLTRLMELAPKDLYDNSMAGALSFDYLDLKLLLKKIRGTSEVQDKLKILSKVNERQWQRQSKFFDELKDSYIEMLMTNEPQDYSMLDQISSVVKFSEILLKIIGDIESDDDAERLLRRCLHSKNAEKLEETKLVEIKTWMKKLEIYREIAAMFRKNNTEATWAKIKKFADENPAVLVNFLLNIESNLTLLIEFLKIHPLTNRSDEITKMWVEALNIERHNDDHELMFKIIEMFPLRNVVYFFDYALGFINNLPSMARVVNFLTENIKHVPVVDRVRIRYQKFTISTKIFENIDEVSNDLWGLASRPLLIIEQLLMNSRVQVLKNVVIEVRRILNSTETCTVCASTSSNMYQVGENLVYDFDAHHDDLFITNECFDLLLKLYAAKALDFQIVEVRSVPASTEVSSLDSTYGVFQIPKEVPRKDQWIPDDATSHCMCCKRQKFSLLTRRHHCRRCGRIVCFTCSQNRAELHDVYGSLAVRVCLDCHHEMNKRAENGFIDRARSVEEFVEWKLTGDVSSDQMVRDEFNFEYSPNVNLCISLIDLHTTNDELAKFLLFHCHRLELLLRPIRGKINPEIDVVLVAKMLKCLAFSAKVRGANGEANTIIDHADVVLKVVENGCESIVPQIPLEPINSVTIRGIINDLIKAENWNMALELSVKWDRTGTAGVFSAWGISAIKCGQYRFAREKVGLALVAVSGSSAQMNEDFLKMLHGNEAVDERIFSYKRSSRSPPLLLEVLDSLEVTASKRKSADSYQSSKESARNVLNVMQSLRNIVDGDYGPSLRKPSDKFEWTSTATVGSPYYDESMFYLLNYAGNVEILTFLMRNNLVPKVLRYVLAQQVPAELFIQHVFVPVVKAGRLVNFIELIRKMDASLNLWKDYIISACKYLERRHAFNCLYQMQILTADLVRAALTCIKFYLDGSGNYTELNSKAHHLLDAKSHLQTELEKTESKKVEKLESGKKNELTLKWDLKSINTHINIISLQLEISKYLAQCETDGLPTIGLMSKIFMDKPGMKTMFGKGHEQNQVAILLLVCGHSIDSGFGISFRVIQECSLNLTKIYSTCTKFLAKNRKRLMEVEKLVNSIRANAANEENVVDSKTLKVCDELVAMAVEIAYNQFQADAKTEIDQLIKLISSKKMKIQCYINSNQLKTAYMLSAAQNNLDDIRRIMKQAEITRQENVRRLCEKKLQQRPDDNQSQGSISDINQM